MVKAREQSCRRCGSGEQKFRSRPPGCRRLLGSPCSPCSLAPPRCRYPNLIWLSIFYLPSSPPAPSPFSPRPRPPARPRHPRQSPARPFSFTTLGNKTCAAALTARANFPPLSVFSLSRRHPGAPTQGLRRRLASCGQDGPAQCRADRGGGIRVCRAQYLWLPCLRFTQLTAPPS